MRDPGDLSRRSQDLRHWRIVVAATCLVAGTITPVPSGVTIIIGLIPTGPCLLALVALRWVARRRAARFSVAAAA